MLRELLRRAGESCHEEHCPEAIDLLEAALRMRPADMRLHERLGLCYSGGCRAHGYASPEVAVAYLRHALALAGPAPVDAPLQARILDTLGNTYARMRRFAGAVECHQRASELYLAAGALEDWAREQFNLANTWCETGQWFEAIACYRRAIRVRTRERDPRRWAAAMENLGSAYRELRQYGDAIACYRSALRVYTISAWPLQNAALHNNLGNIYLAMAGTRQARRALRHLDRALAVRTRELSPLDYAVTQFNRGHALARLLMPEGAARCFGEAQECFAAAGQAENAELSRCLRQQAEVVAGPLCADLRRDIDRVPAGLRSAPPAG